PTAPPRGGRTARRAAGGRSDRRAARARGGGGRGGAARAAGDARGVVRIENPAERRLIARRAERKLGEIRLADQNGAGFTQPAHERRVVLGDVSSSNARGGGRRLPGDIYEIFNRDRHAVQRPTIHAAASLFVDRP